MAEPKKTEGVVEAGKKEDKDQKAKSAQSKNVEKILEVVKKMNVMELSQLVKAMEKEFGVTAAAPVVAAAPGAAP